MDENIENKMELMILKVNKQLVEEIMKKVQEQYVTKLWLYQRFFSVITILLGSGILTIIYLKFFA